MNDNDLEERMRNAISAGPLEPSPTTWPGVVARRTRRDTQRTQTLRWLTAAGTVGVAASLMLITRGSPTESGPVSGFDARSAVVEGSMFSPEALFAQTTSPVFAPVSPDDPIGLRLRPGVWRYSAFRGSDSLGGFTYSLQRATLNARPVWLMVSGQGSATRFQRGADSLWATADSLRPLMRVSLLPSGRREQTFREDDVLIGTTRNGYTTWRTIPLRDSTRKHAGAVIRTNEIAVMLQAMPLSPTWKGSIPLAGSGEFGRITPVWFNFQVEGSEVVTVPAGTFDSWRIRMGMLSEADSLIKGERPGVTMWVSKDRQWLVQQTIVIPGKDGWKQVLAEVGG